MMNETVQLLDRFTLIEISFNKDAIKEEYILLVTNPDINPPFIHIIYFHFIENKKCLINNARQWFSTGSICAFWNFVIKCFYNIGGSKYAFQK